MNLHVQQARSELAKMTAAGVSMREISQKADCAYNTVRTLSKCGHSSGVMALSILNAIGVIKAERPEIAEKIAKMESDALAQIVCAADDQPSNFVLENRAAFETLHDKVEAIAADRVDHDKGAWDVDLNCAKYRRVMQLEKELEQTQDVLAQREQHLKSCENALIEAHEKIDAVLQQRNKFYDEVGSANAEIKRLTALADTHGQSWKAACVQVEQLQKQLDHGQAQFASLHESYNQQVDDEAEMLAQIDALFAERDNMRTKYEYSLMRLRVRSFALVCAIVFLIVSGLVLWGAV